ncbi:transcription factor S [Halocalculus aciditolerans]|uniref:Transcription factor S n=1 Tax=Halocalculus aciditolerans TaxID=1383812 RepID=A0A830FGP2_9EURY|nr:transcription factor S [Halocalculus aciditolerans]GGL51060.1 transcription factor S [Halocalculus aciditolerans]
MDFCDECGSMMHADDGELVCSSCGHREPRESDGEFVTTSEQDTSDVIETEEGASFEGKPTTETECERCGHDTAYYTIKQTGAADEPPARFFKCEECGYRWREYS